MPSQTEGRERQRSRSRRRDHHNRRRRHRSRSRNRASAKHKIRSTCAAFFNMLAVVILCMSLAEPKWFSLTGGGCKVNGQQLEYLGANQFFYPGKFLSEERDFADNSLMHVSYKYGPDVTDRMDDCVTFKAVWLMKTVIVFCFLAIFNSLFGCVLDLFVHRIAKNRYLKLLQRNAIPSILTVILSVVMNLFCYWATTEIEQLQKDTKPHPGLLVIVDFDISFYLLTAAGAISIVATAINCLYQYPQPPTVSDNHSSAQLEALLENYDGMEVLPPPLPAAVPPADPAPVSNLPPPPPYTP